MSNTSTTRLDIIRAALVSALSSVPDIGVVHNRERYAGDESRFRALFLFSPTDGPQQLRGWTVRRLSSSEHVVNLARSVCIDTWVIRGYMAFNDEQSSELTFDRLVEQFRDLVRADPTLGEACAQSPQSDSDNTDCVQVTDSGPVRFAGVLCHSAVLQLRTWSYV